MFEHVAAARRLHNALFAHEGDAIYSDMRDRVRRAVRREMTSWPRRPNVPMEFAVHFVAGAFVSVVGWWLAEGQHIPAVDADRLFQDLCEKGSHRRADAASPGSRE